MFGAFRCAAAPSAGARLRDNVFAVVYYGGVLALVERSGSPFILPCRSA